MEQSEAEFNGCFEFPDTPCFSIFAYNGVVWGVNVGIYGMHGVFRIV